MINFGDGTTVAGPTASHTYATVGQYLVTATVTDAAGSAAVATQEISAKAASSGVTIISPATAAVVNWPTPTFVASANSSNPVATMSVSVDGTQIYAINQDTINTPLKIYQGSHTIAVQAVDSKGNASNSSVQVIAEPNDSPPIPAIQVTALPNVAPNTVLICGAGVAGFARLRECLSAGRSRTALRRNSIPASCTLLHLLRFFPPRSM